MTVRRGIYNSALKKYQRTELRNASTAVEAILWTSLQGRKLGGKKFRREMSIGPYIVDFYCPECRLAVELDGARHFGLLGSERDSLRTQYFGGTGNSGSSI